MPDAHLDDEQLSALVDRDADDEHVRACAACRGRLEALTAAAALVGAPVAPLSADLVDRMVARAVDDADQATRIVPIESFERRRRWSPSPAILGAVAAVLVLLLGVPIVFGGGGSSRIDSQTAAGDASEEATEAEADSLAADSGEGTAADESLTREAAGGTASVAAPTGDLDARAQATLAFETEADLVDHLIAVLSTTPPAEGSDDTTPEPPSSCESAARQVGGSRLGGRTYVGAIQWRSIDAEVHVFDLTEPVGGASRQGYVMASRDCRVLAEPRF